jgi:uncharacterized membrane protein YwzB
VCVRVKYDDHVWPLQCICETLVNKKEKVGGNRILMVFLTLF